MATATEPQKVADFLHRRKDAVLDAWGKCVRALPKIGKLPEPALLDHLPPLLGKIADMADELAEGHQPSPPDEVAARHAYDRLDQGLDLCEVVEEYGLLRGCLLRLWAQEEPASPKNILLLDQAIDMAVRASVERYVEARDRTLQAIDRVSTAALESKTLVELITKLLDVFVDASIAVDGAAVFLREGDHLVLHAAVGALEERLEEQIRIGDDFGGKIAQARRPLVQRPAWKDVETLFGIPLIDEDELIGVAYMASRSALQFSRQDEVLFNAMARRATSAIAMQALRETADRRAADLRESEERLRLAVEGAALGTWDYCTSGRTFTWSARSRELLGVGLDEPATYEAFMERVHPDDRARTEAIATQALDPAGDGDFSVDFRVGETDVRWLTARGRAVFEEVGGARRAVRVSGIVIDITSRKITEEQLVETARFRERFIGILAHDLRNPLNAIRLTVRHIFQGDGLQPAQTRALGRITSAALRMQRMIDDVVDFTRGRLGAGIPLRLARVDLVEVCRKVLDELETIYPDRTLVLDAPPDCIGDFDADRMAQVVSNLGANALRHGDRTSPVRVTLQSAPDKVTLAVANRGPVIPTERRADIFEPFRQLPSSHEGLGLGLYIVREIVQAHGGRVDLESSEEETVFTVTLPRSA
jgi:PAS domain S-box-containing protein